MSIDETMHDPWIETNRLRFVKRTVEDGHSRFIQVRILQQQWQNGKTGAYEWRDVPCVEETT